MRDLINLIPSIAALQKQIVLREIVQTNLLSQEYGLTLSEADARKINAAREVALASQGRIEPGESVVSRLIEVFCDSPYLWQENYVETLIDLMETFYYMKNETLDEIGDDQLLAVMKDYFDHHCQGAIELLQGRELETLARNIRFGLKAERENSEDEVW